MEKLEERNVSIYKELQNLSYTHSTYAVVKVSKNKWGKFKNDFKE